MHTAQQMVTLMKAQPETAAVLSVVPRGKQLYYLICVQVLRSVRSQQSMRWLRMQMVPCMRCLTTRCAAYVCSKSTSVRAAAASLHGGSLRSLESDCQQVFAAALNMLAADVCCVVPAAGK